MVIIIVLVVLVLILVVSNIHVVQQSRCRNIRSCRSICRAC